MSMLPFFLEGPSGSLFCNFFEPARATGKFIVHVPAFAEEMNKSRRMVANQARQWAASGMGVLLFDFYGTGDSEGEFRQASWRAWKADLTAVLRWVHEEQGGQVSLWGLRLGGLLALDYLSSDAPRCHNLILWQPLLNGNTALTQFLRIGVAASLFGKADQGSATTKAFKERLANGENVELAGYELNPDLANPMLELNVLKMQLPMLEAIYLSEISNSATNLLSPQFQNLADAWQNQGQVVKARKVQGEQFWATQEIAEAPALISSMVDL